MDEYRLSIIESSKYFKYLEDIGIETDVIKKGILSEYNYNMFDSFINNLELRLSPNTYTENFVFTKVCKYLNDNYAESFIFENNGKIDIKSIIAHSNSLIQRPDITTPFESSVGSKEPDNFNGFIRIARFEQQLAERDYSTNNTKRGTVLFEGLLPVKMHTNPLFCQNVSDEIWNDTFCFGEPRIQGIYPNLHSIEAPNVLWVNSELLDMLGLTLDTYKNGLRALTSNQEAVLIYRQWREKLIGNGASLAGTNSNIARLEGCDLILREDYYAKLHSFVPDMVFYTFKL